MSRDLHRRLAPVSASGWRAIESEAEGVLRRTLAGRRLFDFKGPLGWELGAVNIGRLRAAALEQGKERLRANVRLNQPLVELSATFEVARSELDALDRGAPGADLDDLAEAARTIALAEDHAVFHGMADAGIRGVMPACSHQAVELPEDFTRFPRALVEATERLREAGVDGPYALALGSHWYAGLTGTTDEGYPVIEHVRRLVDGPIVWAHALGGAVLVSQRGGDFELCVGGDFAIAYRSHDAETVVLQLVESFAFTVVGDEAAVPLVAAPEAASGLESPRPGAAPRTARPGRGRGSRSRRGADAA